VWGITLGTSTTPAAEAFLDAASALSGLILLPPPPPGVVLFGCWGVRGGGVNVFVGLPPGGVCVDEEVGFDKDCGDDRLLACSGGKLGSASSSSMLFRFSDADGLRF
jgi:hypothetical protein